MKSKLFFILFICATTLFAQRIPESIESKKLNGTREFTVVLPSNYESSPKKIPCFSFIRWRIFIKSL